MLVPRRPHSHARYLHTGSHSNSKIKEVRGATGILQKGCMVFGMIWHTTYQAMLGVVGKHCME